MNDAPTSGIEASDAIDAYTEYQQIYNEATSTWETITIVHDAISAKVGTPVSVTLSEFHAKYDANNIYVVLEYGKISYKNNPDGYDSSSGYYIDLGYNIGSLLGCEGKIIPWIRLSNVARADNIDSQTSAIFRTGLTFKPINNVAFKFDYGKVTIVSDSDNPTTEINFGIGYNF